ncbi:protein arginine N-methyltransferase PRMT10 [Sesamum angolense]|uniref:Protein arginine N-methyltransferase PRMT10 n=1 Tax=Sesamum angolense TaxID=2727404 RepID=A0AAE1WE79_9LAMI|nr:protein arginine N-methyltransferase PRMT10 [Sesamum angolense]
MFDVICYRQLIKLHPCRYPSHARMWMAPIRSGLVDQKMSDYEGAMQDWRSFIDETKSFYGVDMSVLTNPFTEEQKKYYLQVWCYIALEQPSSRSDIGTCMVVKEIDCLTATINDIRNVHASISSSITEENMRFCGFGGWFDVHFRGSNKNPAQHEIELTTAPSEDYGTHWGQQVFLLHPPLRVQRGDDLILQFSMSRSKDNHRLMEVDLSCEMRQSGKSLPAFQKKFYIDLVMCGCLSVNLTNGDLPNQSIS